MSSQWLFFLFSLILPALITPQGLLCPGDTSRSYCVMCKGSNLLNIWDKGLKAIESCHSATAQSPKDQALCFCKAYSLLAMAWRDGRCCTEYHPTLAAATSLCHLPGYPESAIVEKIGGLLQEADRILNAIWHNDSGAEVPVAKAVLPPYNSNEDHNPPVTLAKNTDIHQSKKEPSSTLSSKATLSNHKNSFNNNLGLSSKPEPESKQPTTHNISTSLTSFSPQKIDAKKESDSEKGPPVQESNSEKTPPIKESVPGDVHHLAKVKKVKTCDDSIKYRNAARSSHKRSLFKRNGRFGAQTHSMSSLHKRKAFNCGIDFLGVPYPETVPQAVLKAWQEL